MPVNFCAQACDLLNDDCPNGYACRQKESVDGAIAAQCVPYTAGGEYEEESNEIEPYGEISCQAHRDYLEHKGCGRRSGGGGGPGGWVGCADGAICSGWGITSTLGDNPNLQDSYTCSIFCTEDDDCPGEDSFCEEITEESDEPRAPRCAPVQD